MSEISNVISLTNAQFKKAKEVLVRLENNDEIRNKTELEIMSLLKKYDLLTSEFLEDLEKI